MLLRYLPALSIGLILLQFAPDAAAQFSMNGSEPWFTRGIGPRAPRKDNPIAAALTAAVVAGLILIGLWEDDRSAE